MSEHRLISEANSLINIMILSYGVALNDCLAANRDKNQEYIFYCLIIKNSYHLTTSI